MTDPAPPTPEILRNAFGLAEIADRSLSPFARVFRGRTADDRPVVVKRTAERTAGALADWTAALSAAGVAVVTPVPLTAPSAANPQQIDGQQWVVYPFVEGQPYRGTAEQIRAAGVALGELHAADVSSDHLQHYVFPETTRDEVDADLVTLRGVYQQNAGDRAEALHARLTAAAEVWHSRALPALAAADRAGRLPRTGGTADHKAANLIYPDTGPAGGPGGASDSIPEGLAGAGPVMVDPDNAERLPRILDLALALVTFHNECPTAPGRLFEADEWSLFVQGYRSRVTPTPAEQQLWPAAVLHQWWEEGTWALEDNDADAWADDRQRAYLLSLAAADPEAFPL